MQTMHTDRVHLNVAAPLVALIEGHVSRAADRVGTAFTPSHVRYVDIKMVAHDDAQRPTSVDVGAAALEGIRGGRSDMLADDVIRAVEYDGAIDRTAASTL
jgi:hypothetical protein